MKRFIVFLLALGFSSAIGFSAFAGEMDRLWVHAKISQYYLKITVREGPSIHSKRIGRLYKYPPMEPVFWTGTEIDGYFKIPFFRNGHEYGWVFGEYFGKFYDIDYVEFKEPRTYVSRIDRIIARCGPSVLSSLCGFCRHRGTKIKIIGSKGFWLKTDKNKWIYFELLKPYKP